ncbi:DUF502 domain-containing protein [Jannaschia aquimarina]|uniref:DUF502 domain-containing protein n=1 Tax=Jannaschia aquimarina TaxID=935700 RepID=A0A0D1EEN3_9RHOB|nr:DUF502 domain-containing protein [Jannaschia aquimarina]KIT16159.1 hypothetical protein jaqu_21210 [Jannaschia aquimarina]SNT36971.1 Uncharacterized membrane protein [Jannaschia aquimarina]
MQLGDTPPPRPPRAGILTRLRNNFLTGLIVIAPIGLTLWLIWSVIGWIDGFVLPFVPRRFNPDVWLNENIDFPIDIRGIGVGIFLVFTVIVGWLAKGFIGRALLRSAERLVSTMPVVRSVYAGIKQIAETILAQDSQSFEQACLVEYPRRGIWAVAFVSTAAKGEVAAKSDKPMLSLFLPTTPNPTSGFLLFAPEEDVVMLDMTVEEAAKLVISAGLVYPNGPDQLPDLKGEAESR